MRIYKGYDIIYSFDECGYYVQDFNEPEQPTSCLYDSLEEIKKAIDDNNIVFRKKVSK